MAEVALAVLVVGAGLLRSQKLMTVDSASKATHAHVGVVLLARLVQAGAADRLLRSTGRPPRQLPGVSGVAWMTGLLPTGRERERHRPEGYTATPDTPQGTSTLPDRLEGILQTMGIPV
jgi:hypothetical protein